MSELSFNNERQDQTNASFLNSILLIVFPLPPTPHPHTDSLAYCPFLGKDRIAFELSAQFLSHNLNSLPDLPLSSLTPVSAAVSISHKENARQSSCNQHSSNRALGVLA